MRQTTIHIDMRNNHSRTPVKPMGPAVTNLKRSSMISLSPRRSTLIGTKPHVIIINEFETIR